MSEYTYTFNQERTFGIEIECIIKAEYTRTNVLQALEREGLRVRDPNRYSHTNSNDTWVMKWDGSIRNHQGSALRGLDACLEIVSPILHGMDGINQVKIAYEVLSQMCEVNRSCGLHVHHGATDLTGAHFAALYVLYARNQKVIDMLCTPSRRSENSPQYCKPLALRPEAVTMNTRAEGRTWAQQRASAEDRYRVVNFQSYVTRGTIEFRQHHATMDGSKAIAWIVFTQACLEFAKNAKGRQILDYGTLQSFTPINGLGWRVGLPRTGESFEAKQYYRLRSSFNLFVRQKADQEALRQSNAAAAQVLPSMGTTVRRLRNVAAVPERAPLIEDDDSGAGEGSVVGGY